MEASRYTIGRELSPIRNRAARLRELVVRLDELVAETVY
jgi:hypothetical protein